MAFDPIAALKPVQVDFEIGGYEYTLPALPASTWIRAALDPDGGAIIPGLLESPQDRADIWAEYVRGNITPEEVRDTARAVLEAATGRPWWEASRIITGATHEDAWPVMAGELFARGVDLDQLSIAAFCHAAYATAVRNGSKEEREKLDFQLKAVPDDVQVDDVVDESEEMAAFMRDFAELGG